MLDRIKTIGVVGAGTMGIGIAEVAAAHGQNVVLYDLDKDFAQTSLAQMTKRLESRVARGKVSQDVIDDILARVQIVSALSDFEEADLVIEAIVENLEIKQKLFQQLEEICSESTLLATNTSSISVTAIASILDQPQRMLGLHFFNPAPVMKLVEVISGLRTSKETMSLGLELCKHWNKVGVQARSTPGFIVNRVARPFYGESLKMLQESVADVETLDVLMRNAGFRMGPFQLMDLIGIDVNLAVSKTVYETMFYDPRYKPSLIQQEMVYAQLLGKKTAQGFYDYTQDPVPFELEFEAVKEAPKVVSLSENNSPLMALLSDLHSMEDVLVTTMSEGQEELVVDDCCVTLSNGKTCDQRLKDLKTTALCQVDLVLDFQQSEFLCLAFNSECTDSQKSQVVGLFQKLGKKVLLIDDTPALCVMRVVSLLINEAADAVSQGVCSEEDVDLAMTYGVNYPKGLLQWSKMLGHNHVVQTLENLQFWFGDDRYRVTGWLRKQ